MWQESPVIFAKKTSKKPQTSDRTFFANRLFRAIDADQNGCITCDEFVNFMYDLECRGTGGRIRLLFDLYDIDGSGGLTYNELILLLTASVQESNSQMEMELIEHLAECIIDSFDEDGDREISFQEFAAAVSDYPHLLTGLTVIGLGSDNSKPKGLKLITRANDAVQQGVRTVVNNPQRTFWLLILFGVLAMAFWWRASAYDSGYKNELMSWTLPVAKGCGQMIKVTTTLILLPVSRRTTTFLRETPLHHVIPFDDAIPFHILLGTLGFVFAWIHSLCHVNDFWRWGDSQRYDTFRKAFPEDEKQPSYYELWISLLGVTGVIQLISYTLVFITASNWPRRASWLVNTRLGKRLNDFNLIWKVHHLTVIFIVSLLVHAVPHVPDEDDEWDYSDVWAWVGIPVLIYLMDRIGGLCRQTKNVEILSAELLPGKVIALKMSKPKGFSYDCGMSVYINCSKISHFEWHPFSLTSAPGAKHLSVHIRVAGDWTEALYNRFRDYAHTLRHEEFSVAQTHNVIPNLHSMSQHLHSQSLRSLEVSPLRPRITFTHGRRSSQRLPNPGNRDGRVEMDRQVSATSGQGSIVETPSEVYCSIEEADGAERALQSTFPATPPMSIVSSITDDVSEVVNAETASGRRLKSVTPSEERFLTRMAPSPHMPGPSPVVRQGQLNTPFAAFSGTPDRGTPCEMRRAQPTPVDQPGSSALNLSQMNSFLLDLSHMRDLDADERAKNEEESQVPVKLLLDGPFGAPAQGYRDYSVLLLVGAGIGVTPFASVLSDLVHRMHSLSQGDEKEGLYGMPHLKKVYFHWSVRSQSEVVWFSRVLEAITKEDTQGLLDVNIHITGLRSANDVRTMPLKLVQVAVHHHTGVDVMCGLRCRVLTRFGRPDWCKIFRKLQAEHKRERIGVFYSGPNTLASVLRKMSHKHSKRGNKFNFVKESFGYW